MKSLGVTLKKTRESISLTLRQVEDATGISNAYLSQLENDKIKKPSANVLYKLSSLYKIELNELLEAAGIIKKSDKAASSSPNHQWVNRIAFYADDLNPKEKKDVLNYIKFKVSAHNS